MLYLKSLSLDSLLFREELSDGVAVRLESAALQIGPVLQEVELILLKGLDCVSAHLPLSKSVLNDIDPSFILF